MLADEYSLRYYVAGNRARPFGKWLQSLSDLSAAAQVQVRLDRLRFGNLGNARSLRKGLWELCIDMGPGYRVYFTQEGKTVLLLCGGDKGSQSRDIRRAREYLADYRRRSDA